MALRSDPSGLRPTQLAGRGCEAAVATEVDRGRSASAPEPRAS